MKIRAPLSAQIFGWFLLNVTLIGLLVYGFVHAQFHLGLDSLIAGRAGDRIEAVSGVIIAELRENPEEDWGAILGRFSAHYGVQFALFRADGRPATPEGIALPAEARSAMDEFNRPPPPRNRPDPADRPPRPRQPPPFNHPKKLLRTTHPSRYWVMLRTPLNAPGRPVEPPFTLVAASDSLSGGGLFFDWKPWLAIVAACLAVSVLCWIPLARGWTVAIRRLTQATGRMAEGKFDVRVPEDRGDELGSLAGSVNRMASRLEGYLTGQKRFLGDIAHELCAPIARLQMALGILEQRSDADTQGSVADLREEIEQMSALVGELLSFSKASLAGTAITRRATPLRALVQQATEREAAPGVEFVVDAPADSTVLAEPDLLLRALGNLLRNAARYAGGAGPITVRATLEGARWALRVSDRGPGIPAGEIAKIFDPFYRVDVSRDRATGGAGLGLAIVKTCVEACGGTVACRRLEPGLEVTLYLQPFAN